MWHKDMPDLRGIAFPFAEESIVSTLDRGEDEQKRMTAKSRKQQLWQGREDNSSNEKTVAAAEERTPTQSVNDSTLKCHVALLVGVIGRPVRIQLDHDCVYEHTQVSYEHLHTEYTWKVKRLTKATV